MKRLLIITFVLLSLWQITFAQEMEEYLQLAAENNPELKAYFSEYLAALERVPQVGGLPDPELSMGFFLQTMERVMGNQQADIQLMQMFPWFGMLRARKDEASKMALARYEVFQDAKNRLFYEVKSTWYEMYRLEKEISVTEENLAILRAYERLALVRFQNGGSSEATPGSMPNDNTMNSASPPASESSMGNMGGNRNGSNSSSTNSAGNVAPAMGSSGRAMRFGKSGMSDVLRIRIEMKGLDNTLASLQDAHAHLQAEFNQHLNRDYHEPVRIADTLVSQPLILNHHALLDSITMNHPMLKMLDAETEAYEVQEEMARLEGRPMLGAGITYMPFRPRVEDGMSMGGNDMLMPMLRMSIPIYRKKYTAMRQEAALKQQAVQQRKEQTVNQLTTQWHHAIRDLDDATRRTTLYQEQAALARQTLNLLRISYTSEGQGLEEVLSVQQQLLDFQLKLITAIVDQHVTAAMLERLATTELDN